MDELDQLRPALHRDPRGVAERTTVLVAAARASGDRALRSRCLALRGRARRSLGEMELAEVDLREAVDAADGPDAPQLAADAHLGLAGVLAWAGRTVEAFEHLDRAAALGDEQTVAYASLQRASVAQRAGHHDVALVAYEAALPALRRLGLRTDQALVHMNRAMIRVTSGDLPGAFGDLALAEELFAAEQNDFGMAQVQHGIGVAHLRGGDVPAALAALDAAANRFGDLGHDALDVQVDRVEALLAAGLAADAAFDAAGLARRFEEAGSHSLAAEAWLRAAQAARLDGDLAGALERARRARSLFADHAAVGWERLARLEMHRVGGELGDRQPGELQSLGRELVEAGDPVGAATAAALACRDALAVGALDDARSLAGDCARRTTSVGVLEVRLLAAHASASVAAAAGETKAARRHLRRGLDDLTRDRALLGASDARAAVAGHAEDLVRLGLRLAAADGRPAGMFEWSEWARAGRRRHVPVRPPDDDELALELAQLRGIASEVRGRQAEGDDVGELLTEQRRLERAVQRRHLRAVGAASIRWRPPSLGGLRERLGDRTFVTLVDVDGRLVAMAAGARHGVVTDLGPTAPAAAAAAAIAAGLRALADPVAVGRGRAGRVDLLRRALDLLDATLAPVLCGDGPLLLALPAALHAVPWSALPTLAARPVAVVPSASWWFDLPAADHAGGAVFVAAGPRLELAEAEAVAVAARHDRACVVTGPAATGEAVLEGLRTASVSHVVAHGRIRHDSPSWSSLELADGPLCLYELERAERTSAVVVLSACDSGIGVRAGDQLVGLSSCLLGMGTRSLVASVCRLPDSSTTVALMGELHGHLVRSDSAAVALAALDRDRPGTERWVHAASIAVFGDV